jgi:shikimate dehydrogenase
MSAPYAEIIGDPVFHSKSPLIHGFWLGKLGLKGDYRAVRVTPEELEEYLQSRRRDSRWRGCNVTMPLKARILPLLTSVEELAEKVGAVNCVINMRSPDVRGYNTDVNGVSEPLSSLARPGCDVAAHVQVIGAGGAARAAVMGAIAAGFDSIDVFNRSPQKAHGLARLAGARSGKARPLDDLGPVGDDEGRFQGPHYSHIVINATPMGMNGSDPVPIDLSSYSPDTIVFDMVYSPLETPLLRQARSLGLRTIDGLQMLVGQAARAFELLFGAPAPREHDAELRELLVP